MEVDEDRSDFEKDEEEEDDSVSDLLRDRFRLSAISIAEHEAKRNGMEISPPIVACIADLAFKYIVMFAMKPKTSLGARALLASGQMAHDIEHHRAPPRLAARQLAKDLELFAHHAGRKSVTMADVIVSVHRNEHLAASLKSFHDELKAKEPQCERKRKKVARKDDKAVDGIVSIPDL
ncbi:hypothetical protein V6N13_025699 [Hibiscus sabdariffa]|uniref:Centromere protein S n=1 Tax=Hibiscus sabdariffa TaxID=183260 RepID=A0ABR2C9V1_9ROSI